MKKVLIKIGADGTVTLLEVEPTLENLQKIVGGYIETVRTWIPDIVMIVNEEGKMKDKPLNSKASSLINTYDCIVGDVVLVQEWDEEFVGISEAAAKAICKNALYGGK